eukprot:scaffold2082_cov323-Chaetoceros_neogracile.AAC.1
MAQTVCSSNDGDFATLNDKGDSAGDGAKAVLGTAPTKRGGVTAMKKRTGAGVVFIRRRQRNSNHVISMSKFAAVIAMALVLNPSYYALADAIESTEATERDGGWEFVVDSELRVVASTKLSGSKLESTTSGIIFEKADKATSAVAVEEKKRSCVTSSNHFSRRTN